MKKKPIPRIIASEKTKLVARVVISLLFTLPPLLVIKMSPDKNVPVKTEINMMIIRRLLDMKQKYIFETEFEMI
jgi:hypothetical protein